MSLRASILSAGRWTTASSIARVGLQFAQTMVLARLLGPSDFGQMAIAASFIAVLAVFADAGMSRALIHFPTPDHRALSSLYWLNLGVSSTLMALVAAAAFPLSQLYNDSDLASLLIASSLIFPISALSQQFRVLAEKEMQFAMLARIEVAAALAGFCVAVASALLGAGVYSLVAGSLGNAAIITVLSRLYLATSYQPLSSFHPASTFQYLRFGGYQIAETLLNTLRLQSDILIGGAMFGASSMGIYSVPRDLSLKVANTVVNPIVSRVSLPAMAKLQGNKDALKKAYLQIIRATSSINFPIYLSMAAFSDEIVALVLGNQWNDAGPFLRIFAIWGLIRSVGNPVGNLLYSTGRVRLAFWWNASLLAGIPPLLWMASKQYGMTALALAMLVIQAAIFIPAWRVLVRPTCGATLSEYVGQILPPLVSSILAVAAGYAFSAAIGQPIMVNVVSGLAISGVLYLLISLRINRPWVSLVVEALKLPVRL